MRPSKHFCLFFSYRLLDHLYTAFRRSYMDSTLFPPSLVQVPKNIPAPTPLTINSSSENRSSFLMSQTTAPHLPPQSAFLAIHSIGLQPWLLDDASTITLGNVNFTQIPLLIKGGVIRVQSAMATKVLRKKGFGFVRHRAAKRLCGCLRVFLESISIMENFLSKPCLHGWGCLSEMGNSTYDVALDSRRV
jgi:hypothetical protein